MLKTESTCVIFWFRRDLRLEDNTGLLAALESGHRVLCVFIFDREILEELQPKDARVEFIHRQLEAVNDELARYQSGLLTLSGKVPEELDKLTKNLPVQAIYTNRDYEPYARKRDQAVGELLKNKGIEFHTFKDQVHFEPGEIMKSNGTPYTVYTPYKNAWLARFQKEIPRRITKGTFVPFRGQIPALSELGFVASGITVRPYHLNGLDNYAETRDIPSLDATSYLSTHLRFGTVSIRQVLAGLDGAQTTFLNELIWREFFMQILYFFPYSAERSFKPAYDLIRWENNDAEFLRWCEGKTGYPLVDAGMRQLLTTGVMHNRVRMVCASFLCKHLLIDWRLGEAWFAKHLLDFDLSANVGNWQWAAGSGCDAAPYFRVFNPGEQLRKFDPESAYVKTWVPEFGSSAYPEPMVEHARARLRALDRYKSALSRG